jgi:hypothetical protein
MRSVIIRIAEHQEYGSIGAQVESKEHFAEPAQGFTVAHDILEHFPGDDGSSEAEFMALGASLYVRDADAWYHYENLHKPSVAENMGPELPEQIRYMEERFEDGFLRDPGRTKTLGNPIEDYIDQIIKVGVRSCETGEPRPPFMRDSELWKIRGWMRKGYRRAAKRYRKYPEWKMCQIFRNLTQQIDIAIKQHEYEGQEFKILIDLQTEEVRLKEIPREIY